MLIETFQGFIPLSRVIRINPAAERGQLGSVEFEHPVHGVSATYHRLTRSDLAELHTATVLLADREPQP
jgi:hypothetical protein